VLKVAGYIQEIGDRIFTRSQETKAQKGGPESFSTVFARVNSDFGPKSSWPARIRTMLSEAKERLHQRMHEHGIQH
jgi:hypothetical protein